MVEVVLSRDVMTLREVIATLPSLPWGEWIYIPRGTERITFDVPCHFVNTEDYLDDELDAFADAHGLTEFFYCDILSQIASNLAQQRPSHTPDDLEQAINHYWRYDGFVQL